MMRKILALFPLLLASACTVGPNYEGPGPSAATASGTSFARGGTAVGTQAPSVAKWWTALNEPMLDQLEEQALASNPDLSVARARLHQARASLRAASADGAPKGTGEAVFTHAEVPGLNLSNSGNSGSGGSGGSSTGDTTGFNFYNLAFDASWEVDLFGGHRRNVEAARADVDAAEAGVADAQLSLTAELARAYVNLRDRQARMAAAATDAKRQAEILRLTEQRFAAGTASALDVEQQRNIAIQSSGAIVPISAERDAYLNALATLTGQVPGALDAALGIMAPVPLPPQSVAVGDPAALIRRRPDIRAAERKLAAATARIGQAEATKFPRLTFLGLIGIGGTRPGDLVDPDKLTALALPQLSWNFLDFGRNAARVEKAQGARDEAQANYQSTVLSALRDAEDALSRFGARRAALADALRTEESAQRSAHLMQQRYQAGAASRIQALDAERRSISASQSVSQARAALTSDFISLEKALGLGWT